MPGAPPIIPFYQLLLISPLSLQVEHVCVCMSVIAAILPFGNANDSMWENCSVIKMDLSASSSVFLLSGDEISCTSGEPSLRCTRTPTYQLPIGATTINSIFTKIFVLQSVNTFTFEAVT